MMCVVRNAWSCAWLLGGALLVAAMAARAGTLRIDSARSQAQFDVRLLWVKPIRGQFNRVSGSLTWNAHDPHGVVDAWIDVNSVHMAHARYARWLLGAKFFDARNHPRIHFVSAPVLLSSLAGGGPLHGTLTVRGVARAVDFHRQPSHCAHPRTQACTIRVVGRILRSDFGMHAYRALLSDHVQLGLTIVLAPATGGAGSEAAAAH